MIFFVPLDFCKRFGIYRKIESFVYDKFHVELNDDMKILIKKEYKERNDKNSRREVDGLVRKLKGGIVRFRLF